MIFLGMQRKPKTAQELENDPIKKMIETARYRKDLQEDHMNVFENSKQEIKDEIN